MKRIAVLVCDTLYLLTLSLWAGGLLFLWFAARVTANLTAAPYRDIANFMIPLIELFTRTVEVCGITMVGYGLLFRKRYTPARALYVADGVRQMLVMAALFVAEIARYYQFPRLTVALLNGQGLITPGSLLPSLLLQGVLLLGVAGVTAWIPISSLWLRGAASRTSAGAAGAKAAGNSAPNPNPEKSIPPSRQSQRRQK